MDLPTYINHFVHRDLKPQNILLGGSAGNRVAKVADMGLAKSFDKAGFQWHDRHG